MSRITSLPGIPSLGAVPVKVAVFLAALTLKLRIIFFTAAASVCLSLLINLAAKAAAKTPSAMSPKLPLTLAVSYTDLPLPTILLV